MGHNLINNMPFGVVAFDPELRITDSNLAAQELLAPADNIAEALGSGVAADADLSWDKLLREAWASAKTCTFENVCYSRNSRNYVLRIIFSPLADEKTDKVQAGILLIEDITAKLAMQNELAAAERLAAVGKLAARVAHELNNPLDGILRYINLALRQADDNPDDQFGRYLRESRKGLLRMVQIISELLEFSRSTYSSCQEADINKIVEDAAKAMESQAFENQVEFVRGYSAATPNIRSGNLFQVFCNLIKNAIDAMPEGGRLEIRTGCDEHNLLIEFADTGTGLSAEVEEKLFEPFFTTKDPGKGTGLGLAICKDIIERVNGQIRAQNRPAGGCVFTVSIPLEHTSRQASARR